MNAKFILQKGIMTMVLTNGETITMEKGSSGCFLIGVPIAGQAHVARVGAALELWHKRLGHTREARIERMITSGAATGVDLHRDRAEKHCEGCLIGGAANRPHPVVEQKRAETAGELVFGDLFGPVTPTSLSSFATF